MRLPLALLALLLAPSHQQGTQRITTCPCDQTVQQSFVYPPIGGTGVISLAQDASGRPKCMLFVPGGPCAWDGGTCIELGECFGRFTPAPPNFNVTKGVTPGTVILRILSGLGPDVEPNSQCVDYNKALGLLEPYACYGYENKQQELLETANGGLQELTNGLCLCPDTRLSSTPSPSPSLSSSPTPSPSLSPTTPPPSDGAAAARAAEARSLGLGLGIPLGLLAVGALALYAASLATGTPIALLVKGGLGSLGGGGGGGSSGSGSLYRQSALGGAGGAQASSRAKELLSTEATGLLR